MCCPRRDRSFASVCFPAKFLPCLWLAKVFIYLLFLRSLLVSFCCLDTESGPTLPKKRGCRITPCPTLIRLCQAGSFSYIFTVQKEQQESSKPELRRKLKVWDFYTAQSPRGPIFFLYSLPPLFPMPFSLCCNFKLQFLSVQRSHKDDRCFSPCLMRFLSPRCAVPRCTAVMSCRGLLVWMVWQYSLSPARRAGFTLSTPLAFHCWVDTDCGQPRGFVLKW